MEFITKTRSPEKQASDCIVIGVFEGGKLTEHAAIVDKASNRAISKLIKQGDIKGTTGSSLMLHELTGVKSPRALVIGLGKEKEFTGKAFLSAIRTAINTVKNTAAAELCIYLTAQPISKTSGQWRLREAVVTIEDCLYQFEDYKSTKTPAISLKAIALAADGKLKSTEAEQAIREGTSIANGISLAKTLGNQPSNVCTPQYLSQTAENLAKPLALECTIYDREALQGFGMNSLLAVAKGSIEAPKLIVVRYKGASKPDEKPVVLVGKGVTFDSGGISLKPGEGMDEMKYDMCGAASVLGAIQAAAMMNLPLNIDAIIPAVENMPSGGATKPGDIVQSMSGQTIEILNTDAEGRLILCDALTYAEKHTPAAVIDVATLTGACVIALGHVTSGLYANDDTLAKELTQAGDISGDKAWQLPLADEYQDQLKSNFADMANIGGRPAGSITAACFLSRFTKSYAWAHLDIAGTAWKSGKDKGATGRPVSLLSYFLMKKAGFKL